MAYGHKLQGSRFEYKYVINEALARPVRDFARGHLIPDEYADPKRNYEYDVHSLYLDSPSMSLQASRISLMTVCVMRSRSCCDLR